MKTKSFFAKAFMASVLCTMTAAFVGCQEDVLGEGQNVEILPESEYLLDYSATKVEVTINSEEDWGIINEYDWIKPLSLTGKPGETLTLEIDNNIGDMREAEYVVTSGNKFAVLSIKQRGIDLVVTPSVEARNLGDTYAEFVYEAKSDDFKLLSEAGLIISTTEIMENGETYKIDGLKEGAIDFKVEGLTAQTSYYVWAYAKDAKGQTYYSETPIELTVGLASPVVITDISKTSHTFEATISVMATSPSKVGICYSTTEAPTVDNEVIWLDTYEYGENIIRSKDFEKVLKANGTKYYFRSVAEVNGEMVYCDKQKVIEDGDCEHLPEVIEIKNLGAQTFSKDPVEYLFVSNMSWKWTYLSDYGPTRWADQSFHTNSFGFIDAFSKAVKAKFGNEYSYHSVRLYPCETTEGASVMLLEVYYVEGERNVANVSEAKKLGGWVFGSQRSEEGVYTLTLDGFEAGSGAQEFYNDASVAALKSAIDEGLKFWADNRFYIDYAAGQISTNAPDMNVNFISDGNTFWCHPCWDKDSEDKYIKAPHDDVEVTPIK